MSRADRGRCRGVRLTRNGSTVARCTCQAVAGRGSCRRPIAPRRQPNSRTYIQHGRLRDTVLCLLP